MKLNEVVSTVYLVLQMHTQVLPYADLNKNITHCVSSNVSYHIALLLTAQ